jgi:hypothetical protein
MTHPPRQPLRPLHCSKTSSPAGASRRVLGGMWLDYDPVTGRVLGEFKLRPREGTIGVPRLGSALRPLADEFPWQTSGSTLV